MSILSKLVSSISSSPLASGLDGSSSRVSRRPRARLLWLGLTALALASGVGACNEKDQSFFVDGGLPPAAGGGTPGKGAGGAGGGATAAVGEGGGLAGAGGSDTGGVGDSAAGGAGGAAGGGAGSVGDSAGGAGGAGGV